MMLRVMMSVMSVMAPPRLGRGRESQTERNADEERKGDGFKTPKVHAQTESRHFYSPVD